MLGQSEVRALVFDELFPALHKEREKLERIDRWYRWDHDKPHSPRTASREYQELGLRAQTPWLGLVVTTVAQALYVEGYRASGQSENASPWRIWQANGMDGKQIAVHRAALAYGLAYGLALPGETPFGEPMPVMRGVDPSEMVAFYADPAWDDWPVVALRVEPTKINGNNGWILHVYDDVAVHRLHAEGGEVIDRLDYISHDIHAIGVCPVVRFANMLDLRGRSPGEVEPFISVAARIDQTTFDRLVVQRFASWVVRTIAGMAKPDDPAEQVQMEMLLRVSDLLVASDPDTKFGSLPASPLDGFIESKDADIRDLAAVSQTPPHHLLGQMANLSAEALTAAEAAKNRKVDERQHAFGESWEQWLRLVARIAGDMEAAEDYEAQVRWKDVESRSLAQTVDALGKMVQMLGIPAQAVWERVPGVTQQDLSAWKALAAQNDVFNQLLGELSNAQEPAEDPFVL